jgi:[NiFe] hydrogenase assembly HybE family chaperone
MNMVMLPGGEDDWEALELGKKIPQKFPSRTYKFMVNDIDGIGKCQTYSLHSPMHEFVNQDHALAAAQSVLDTLMVESELSEEEKVDEELLGRILRGEETPGLDGVASVEAAQPAPGKTEVLQPQGRLKEAMSRRDLLRGVVLGDG